MSLNASDSFLFKIHPICEKFEDSWQNNLRPQLKELLEGWEGQEREILFHHLLELEVHYRQQTGEPILSSDYEGDFPEYREIISSVLDEVTGIPTTRVNVPDTGEATAFHTRQTSEVPNQLGDYELLERIGKGGMGIVYKARQVSLNRLVALKMITSGGWASEEEIQRFRAEAEAVAQMSHEGIVQIYEVGNVAGWHYFSMAYIEGGTLSKHVSQEPVSPREAAEKMKAVTDAIAYAHHRGIIHRDLKPANVLLTLTGKCKVTDFGLAKKVDSGSDLTATGQVLGTPGYMAPEQASGRATETDERSDVYSLGTMLYSLLCNRPPFQAENIWHTLKLVQEQEPVSPRQFNPSLPRDLETITLKCLEKEPEKRYATAEELSLELARFLNNEPIHARPLSKPARAWRWCKRKPLIAAMMLSLVMAISLGFGFSAYFAVKATRKAEELSNRNTQLARAHERERNAVYDAQANEVIALDNERLAKENAEAAQQQTAFALRIIESMIFEVEDKLSKVPRSQKVRREILASASRDLETISSHFPDSERIAVGVAAIEVKLGNLYLQLKGDDPAESVTNLVEKHFLNALKIYQKLQERSPGEDSYRRNEAITMIGLCTLYFESMAYAKIPPMAEKMLSIQRALVAENPADPNSLLDLCNGIMFWADFQIEIRKFPEGRAACQEVIDLIDGIDIPASQEVAFLRHYSGALVHIGDTYYDQGQITESEPWYRQSFETTEKLLQQHSDDVGVLTIHSVDYERLGNVAQKKGNHSEAEKLFDQSLQMMIKIQKADPDNLEYFWDLAVCYDKKGLVCLQQNKLQQAEQVYKESQKTTDYLVEIDAENPRAYQWSEYDHRRLGSIYEKQFQFELATQTYQRAIEMMSRYKGESGRNALTARTKNMKQRLLLCEASLRIIEQPLLALEEPNPLGPLTLYCRHMQAQQTFPKVLDMLEQLTMVAQEKSEHHLLIAQLAATCLRDSGKIYNSIPLTEPETSQLKTAAFTALQRMLESKTVTEAELRSNKTLHPLQSDKRFAELIAAE